MGGPVAIMAVDPGRVTGVARGVFGPGMEAGIGDALREGVGVETWEVDGGGDYRVQAWELAAEFIDWCEGLVEDGVFSTHDEMWAGTHLCVESFRLRTKNVDLDPVMVSSGLLVLLVPRAAGLQGEVGGGGGLGSYAAGAAVHLQEPADAMRLATNERLHGWGVGRVGLFGRPISEHRRDAFRHLCLRLAVCMGGLVETGGRGRPSRARGRSSAG